MDDTGEAVAYDILIGNAELEAEWNVEDGPSADWVVNLSGAEGAPEFPYDFQPGANCRSPGYGQWAEFCRDAGLHALFFGEPDDGMRHDDGLMSRHPGIAPVTPGILATITAARVRWQESHPDAVPGFDYAPDWMGPHCTDDGVRGRDAILARLLWLEWWMTWALANCERPALYNR